MPRNGGNSCSNELLNYLKERKLSLVVSLSEDATRITGRLQYDSVTNEVMGFVLPINSRNGMPIPFSFKARNALEIAKHFNTQNGKEVASNVTAVMTDLHFACCSIHQTTDLRVRMFNVGGSLLLQS